MDHTNEYFPQRVPGAIWHNWRLTLRRWLNLPDCPLVLQQYRMDCGSCCLAMIAAFHAVPPVLIRRHLMGSDQFSHNGMSATQMMHQAQQVGLTGEVRLLPLSQLSRLTLPVILWWRQSHFVVLSRSRSRQAEILDPARGRLLLSWSQLQLCYSGVSILLAPSLAARTSTQF